MWLRIVWWIVNGSHTTRHRTGAFTNVSPAFLLFASLSRPHYVLIFQSVLLYGSTDTVVSSAQDIPMGWHPKCHHLASPSHHPCPPVQLFWPLKLVALAEILFTSLPHGWTQVAFQLFGLKPWLDCKIFVHFVALQGPMVHIWWGWDSVLDGSLTVAWHHYLYFRVCLWKLGSMAWSLPYIKHAQGPHTPIASLKVSQSFHWAPSQI